MGSIKRMVRRGFGISLLPLWSVGEEAEKRSLRILRPLPEKVYNYGRLYRSVEYRPRVLTHPQEVAHQWREWWPHAAHALEPAK